MLISVGILFAPTIRFHLHGVFKEKNLSGYFSGEYSIVQKPDGAILTHDQESKHVSLPLEFIPKKEETAKIELTDVTIGINFHWERKENQFFRGNLKIIEEDNHLTAINILDIEDYLISVISSEMKATSSLEFLKAHAVISRSWLMAQCEKSKTLKKEGRNYQSFHQNEQEYIGWYDREDHRNFDVCADDHCQRYQGIHKANTPTVAQAVASTQGEVLCHNHQICDARFSKCCGGLSEKFENVWEPVSHPYLQVIYDADTAFSQRCPYSEETAEEWINSTPDVFCNTTDRKILSEVMNDYDQETHHFFRWEVYYNQTEISELICRKLNIDFGDITDLIPLERGESGRIIRLKVIGTRRTLVIGKELIIRKALSESHLYSSAFIVQKEFNGNVLKGFRLKGAGWGHGVGLCQIGAAVMGARGYTYREILNHYFPNTVLEKKY
ncbi:SpoIID/LytB domain-containing protein [Odoribacter lunatus]|uniref:SpoIID/LytB domain-containing protein n=1 Tax=Odoribacter lunatus TaxID=2941335 RepID=UPI00203F8B4D|nr:SpoIID/LytB domain-containing protein [Odoribacter lunatus]